MPGSLVGTRSCSQQNVFNVFYLGRATIPNPSTGENMFQRPLFDMYTKFKTKRGTKKLNGAKIVLSNQGISLVNWTNDEESYALSSVVFCKAVVFTGSKMKVNRTKVYKYAFENLAEVGRGESLSTVMDKNFKYLLKAKKHEPLVVCIIMRDLGPRVMELHAFVSTTNDQAMGLSYSVDMARSMRQSEEWKNSELLASNRYPSAPHSKRIQDDVALAATDQGNPNDEDLPRIIKRLHELGGRGSVISPVVKTSNVNLIRDDIFTSPNPLSADIHQQVKSSMPGGDINRQSRVIMLEQRDVTGAQFKPNHERSSSYNQLNYASIFQEDPDFKFIQKPKENVRQPVNRSKSVRGNFDDPRLRIAKDAQTFVSLDPSGAAEKPNKPVAMVQPRKISGIKVFPFGNDRTGLIPDKDKLKKKKNAEESKSSNQVQGADSSGSSYAQVIKQGDKSQKNQFVIKSTTEEHLNKIV